jgi:hypothetical protein
MTDTFKFSKTLLLLSFSVICGFASGVPPHFLSTSITPSNGSAYGGPWPIEFDSHWYTWTDCIAITTAVLGLDGTNYTVDSNYDNNLCSASPQKTFPSLSAGTHYYQWFVMSNQSEWNATENLTYAVSKADPQINLFLNGSTGNRSCYAPCATNVSSYFYGNYSAIPPASAIQLYRNGTLIGSSQNPGELSLVPTPNYFNYTIVFPGNENYSYSSVSRFLSIATSPGPILTHVNFSSQVGTNIIGAFMNVQFVFADEPEVSSGVLTVRNENISSFTVPLTKVLRNFLKGSFYLGASDWHNYAFSFDLNSTDAVGNSAFNRSVLNQTIYNATLAIIANNVTACKGDNAAMYARIAFASLDGTLNDTTFQTTITYNGLLNGTSTSTPIYTTSIPAVASGAINWSVGGSIFWVLSYLNVTNCTSTPTPTPNATATPSANASATPTPTPTPTITATPSANASATPTPLPFEVVERKFGSSNLSAVIYSNATEVNVSYTAGKQGFQGTLYFALELNYSDYENGLISIEPQPLRVRNGSVISEWSVNLGPSQEFKARLAIGRRVPKILSEVQKVVAVPSEEFAAVLRGTPTPFVVPEFGGENSDFGFNLNGILNLVAGLVGGLAVVLAIIFVTSRVKEKPVKKKEESQDNLPPVTTKDQPNVQETNPGQVTEATDSGGTQEVQQVQEMESQPQQEVENASQK